MRTFVHYPTTEYLSHIKSAAPVQHESREQVAVFLWAKLMESNTPELKSLHHIPNGGARDAITGARLKREGLKPGLPDICLPVARGGYHGLYIELKRKKGGALSQNQRAWLNRLNANGYRAICCSGAAEAIKEIESYLKVGAFNVSAGKEGKNERMDAII